MKQRAPGQGRYAQLEREQRWAVAGLPPGVREPADIRDVYIRGTTLRLRRVERGEEVLWKLAQKVRLDGASPEHVKLTNMYLTEAEHEVLTALPGAELTKTRWRINHAGHTLGVDQFHGHLEGLVLAEVELADSEEHLQMPAWARRDVTDDDRFSGGSLAWATPEDVRALIEELTR